VITDPEELPAGWTPDVEVDEPLVRRLLAGLPDELGHVRHLPVEFVAEGWDNSVWRVGPQLVARVPRRALAVPLLEHEARWLPQVTAPLVECGLQVPSPVRLTPAGRHHPYPWLLLSWVPGELLEGSPPSGRDLLLERLVAALPALHRPAPPQAPLNPFRGPDLRDMPPPRPAVVRAARDVLGGDAVAGLLDVLASGVAAAPWASPRTWCHGDLHPRNLVRTPQGGLGLLDFGDLTRGDPAVDLGVLWTTFTEQQRAVSRAGLAPAYDEDVWVRAQGWAARFVLGVAGNDPRPFEATLRHAVAQLL
jgi:aminoglycoside phosphotransferase (APT) family kinase protein